MSKTLPIITNPSPILRQKSEKIDIKKLEDEKFQEFCDDMVKTMKEKDGMGLAAPQVGENVRVIIVNEKSGPICMINPKVIKKSLRKEWDEEGCLSVPNYYGEVKRCKKVICEYIDRKGNKTKIDATGLLARVILHEIDHLDGILFIDKAKNVHKVDQL